MSTLLDAIAPGNRTVMVEGVSAPIARDTLEILCPGASIVDDPTRQRTRVSIPGSGDDPQLWAPFTTVLSATGGGFSLGNGSISAYARRNGPDTVQVSIVLGFGSTTSFGTGAVLFSIDMALVAAFPGGIEIDPSQMAGGAIGIWSVSLEDFSTPANNRSGKVFNYDTAHVDVIPVGTVTPVGTGTPWTWANGDVIRFSTTFPFVPHPV